MKFRTSALAALFSITIFSCVSTKKFKAAKASYDDLNGKYTQLQGDLNNCNTDKSAANTKNQLLQTGNRWPE